MGSQVVASAFLHPLAATVNLSLAVRGARPLHLNQLRCGTMHLRPSAENLAQQIFKSWHETRGTDTNASCKTRMDMGLLLHRL